MKCRHCDFESVKEKTLVGHMWQQHIAEMRALREKQRATFPAFVTKLTEAKQIATDGVGPLRAPNNAHGVWWMGLQ